MNSTRIYTNIYAAFSAGVFAISLPLIAAAAPDTVQLEKNASTPPSLTADTAKTKSDKASKEVSPKVKNRDATQKGGVVKPSGSLNAVPVVIGPVGPPPITPPLTKKITGKQLAPTDARIKADSEAANVPQTIKNEVQNSSPK